MSLKELAPWVYASFVCVALIEAGFIVIKQRRDYDWSESAASLAVAVVQKLINVSLGATVLSMNWYVWDHRIWTVPMNHWWSYVMLFFAVEFAYYWHHRISHECRWFWASHSVHHSPQKLYLSGAYRLGWTSQLSGVFVFYIPLMWLGFNPLAVLGMLAINLAYQFWLHTELVGRLGWFDRVFNSPSNHRVHHSINPQYLDRNHGGVIMLYDHMFGTYAAEQPNDVLEYGLVKQVNSNNPIRIALNEWIHIAHDLRKAQGVRDVLGYLFGPPGWASDGQGLTAESLRRQYDLSQAGARLGGQSAAPYKN